MSFLAASPLAKSLRRRFPQSLDGAPALLPTENTAMRSSLETWFESVGVRPKVIAEFEDSALMKVFASAAQGFFAAPSLAIEGLKKKYGVQLIGKTEDCRERFIAISAERRLKHPAVIAISQTARSDLFGGES